MDTTCKNSNCAKTFILKRAGAQYCSNACRVAAHRKRHAPLPVTFWTGDEPGLSPISRSLNADGTPALSNEELGARLIEIALQGDGGAAKTGRRFYYLALSWGYIMPDMGASDAAKRSRDAAYARVTRVLGTLRKSGELAWDAVLDLTRELDQWQMFSSPREARANLRNYYDEDRWLGQPYFPMLIVEKDTLEPVCKPIAERWQMPFASSRGYGSLTLQHDAAELLLHRHHRTGQQAVVLFVSDLDPSGLDLQRAWEEALRDFGVDRNEVLARFVRIGLTRAQVRAIRNLRLRQGIEVKPSDSRAESYINQYGDRCWEADILPGTTIGQAIDAEIGAWLDHDMWSRRDGEIKRARALL
jgi:hypothetical protein